jgi:type IV secretion system protein VirD4
MLFARPDIARWSTARSLRKAGLFASTGLILGAAHGHLLRHSGPEHVLVVAGTGKGKTSCLVLPNLLTWRQSILVIDPKADLYPVSAGWRRTFSRVVHLNPTSPLTDSHNPLAAIRLGTPHAVRDVQLVAEMLVNPDQRGAERRSSAEIHFGELAQEAFLGLILYGLSTQRARSLAALNALLVQTPLARLLPQMARSPHAAIQRAASVLTQTDGRDERSGIVSTFLRALRLYTDPLVARATDTSSFALRDLRERAQPMTVYVSVPFSDQERLRPWLRLVTRQLLEYAVSRQEGWPWKLLVLIEETQALRQMALVHEGLTYVRSAGVQFMLVTPSLERLIDLYGTHHNFFEGCDVKVAFGLGDMTTARAFSALALETEVTKRRRLGRQWSAERVKEPLLSPTALMQLRPDKALVLAGGQRVLAWKTFYRANAVWRERSAVC